MRPGGHGCRRTAGKAPGCEAAPYIIRFTEDKPNPLYRRICYTFAWGAVISYAVLNMTGLLVAIVNRKMDVEADLRVRVLPVGRQRLAPGLLGKLPRVLPSTKGEGHERRYFYGSVWAVSVAQPVLGLLWVWLPKNQTTNVLKLVVFLGHFGR